MNADLLVAPTAEQAVLLDAIWEGFQWRRSWPTYDFVDHTVYRKCGISLHELSRSCPRLSPMGSVSRYGWVFCQGHSLDAAPRDAGVGLTMAGLLHVSEASSYATMFLQVLDAMVGHEQSVRPNPAGVVSTGIDVDDMNSIISAAAGGRATDYEDVRQFVHSLLPQEPSTWHSNPLLTSPGDAIALSPALRHFRDVRNVADYVERVSALAPTPSELEPLHESSLALPEALDYLNTTWRLIFGAPLIRVSKATTASQLALECSTREEFAARVSGFWTLMDKVCIPGTTDTTLLALLNFIAGNSNDEVAEAQVSEAIDVLRSVGQLRAAQQHFGNNIDSNERRAARTLQLQWPPPNWGDAWAHVQRRSVWALNVLREAVEERPS